MGDTSDKKAASGDLETQLAAELEKSFFGDLNASLADDGEVIPAPSKPKKTARPAKPKKKFDDVWRETAMENINTAAETLAAIKENERGDWLARFLKAIEQRLGPEALDHMQNLIDDRRKRGKW